MSPTSENYIFDLQDEKGSTLEALIIELLYINGHIHMDLKTSLKSNSEVVIFTRLLNSQKYPLYLFFKNVEPSHL